MDLCHFCALCEYLKNWILNFKKCKNDLQCSYLWGCVAWEPLPSGPICVHCHKQGKYHVQFGSPTPPAILHWSLLPMMLPVLTWCQEIRYAEVLYIITYTILYSKSIVIKWYYGHLMHIVYQLLKQCQVFYPNFLTQIGLHNDTATALVFAMQRHTNFKCHSFKLL